MRVRGGTTVVLAVLICAGCSGDPPAPGAAPVVTSTAPSPSPSAAPSVASSVVPVPVRPVKAPPAAPGELVRRELTRRDGVTNGLTTFRGEPDTTKEYVVKAACADAEPGRTISYVVKVGKKQTQLVRADFACDGSLRQDGIGKLPSGQTTIYLEGGPVESAYAVIVPAG